uniref:VP8 n=1 Tax=viral metagenome TaxID=1070528 RepID=A0A2V0R9S5_9ZZZZ
MALVNKFSHMKGATGTVRCVNGKQTLFARLADKTPVLEIPLPGCTRVEAIAILVNAMGLSLVDYDGGYHSDILNLMSQIGTSSTFKLGRRYKPLYVKCLNFDNEHQYRHCTYSAIVKCCGLLKFDKEGSSLLVMESCKALQPSNVTMHAVLSLMGRLSVMHKDGIVHEDVSPDNLMLSKNGDVVLVDPAVISGANVKQRNLLYVNVFDDDVRLKPLGERMSLDVQLTLMSLLQVRYRDVLDNFIYHNGQLLDSKPDYISEYDYYCDDWRVFTDFKSCDDFLTSQFAAKTRNMLCNDVYLNSSSISEDDDTDEDTSAPLNSRDQSILLDES